MFSKVFVPLIVKVLILTDTVKVMNSILVLTPLQIWSVQHCTHLHRENDDDTRSAKHKSVDKCKTMGGKEPPVV